MREAVLVGTARTPLAKSFRGSLNRTRPDDMMAHCMRTVIERAPGVTGDQIEDIVIGCSFPEKAQGMNIARIAALRAGLPVSGAAMTINRFCASGLEAVVIAANRIVNEYVDIALAGGVESLTSLGDLRPNVNPWIAERYPGIYLSMGQTAEILARRYRITRQEQDEYAWSSQQRTAQAQQAGFFEKELAPLTVVRAQVDKRTGIPKGEEKIRFERDECQRPDTTLQGLTALKPHFESKNGTVTAGNASQLADGASINLLMSKEKAQGLGLQPAIVFRGHAVAGCSPEEMGIGPVHAVPRLLKRTGLTVPDVDLWEINEAFAVQVIYCRNRLGIDRDKLNMHGGSISLGHPYGMTGARLVGTLANGMQRRGDRFGVVAMCVGGGQGVASLFELCS